MFNDRTPHLDLPLPHVDNDLGEDVYRVREAFTTLDKQFPKIDDALQELEASLSSAANEWRAAHQELSTDLGGAIRTEAEDRKAGEDEIRADLAAFRNSIPVPTIEDKDKVLKVNDEGNYELLNILPSGVILMWSGSIETIPQGFALCNGENGTPDLGDSFVMGAGATRAPGATGGSTSATTNESGFHAHNVYVGDYTLTEAQMPYHVHYLGGFIGAAGGSNSSAYVVQDKNDAMYTHATGGNHPHAHAASADGQGQHTHTVNTIPPFYALCYIMKL